MTIGDCIVRADRLRPNAISEPEKIAWCWELEAQLLCDFYPRYVPEPSPEPPEEEETDTEEAETEEKETVAEKKPVGRETELSGSGPFEEMYLYYLAGKIDLASQEVDAYNIDAAMSRQYLDAFKKSYHRTHTHR